METKEIKEEVSSVEQEIISVLDRIRPFIQRDGGDIKLVKYENNIVYIKFFGACVGCISIDQTLGDGIEAILKDEIPEIEAVVNVDAAPYMDNFDTVKEEDVENN